MRYGVVILGVAMLAAGGCRASRSGAASVRLPNGFRHEGVKKVYLSAGMGYEDQLGLKAVEQAIHRYRGLFLVVASPDDADMVMQVSGTLGRGTASGGVGVGIGPVGLGKSTGSSAPSTELSVSVSLRPTGEVVYENLVVVMRHPNVGMPKAAAQLLANYASGR